MKSFEAQIYNEWNNFISGRDIDRAIVRPEIEEAWTRCRRYGVDPFNGRCRQTLEGKELEGYIEEHRELLETARPFLQNLNRFFEGFGYLIMLTDENGTILEFFGEPDMEKDAELLNYRKGSCWMEENVGTTSISMVMHLRQPYQITGAEHYCSMSHRFTCSAAPVTDEDGNMIGILNVSGPRSSVHKHTLGMVVSCAESIHYMLMLRKHNDELKRMNDEMMNIFDTVSEALIVIDDHHDIERINDKALALVDMDDVVGKNINDYLSCSSDTLAQAGKMDFVFENLAIGMKSHGRITHCLMSSAVIGDGTSKGRTIVIKPLDQIRAMADKAGGRGAHIHFDNIITQDDGFRNVIDIAKMAAEGDANVLLEGESGTGKEMFAQAIHSYSGRSGGAFVAVNCGAIPRELIASELFGYEDGAFTGAARGGRPGKFELANHGTLFLDEIGDMPLEQQIALLRVLQERKLVRIGGDREIDVDVRVICASHKSIKEEAAKGNFREDLFYRLNVIFIRIPPLRERTGDIMLLFNYFMECKCSGIGRAVKQCSPDAAKLIEGYPWPGNIRELQNIVERLAYTSPADVIGAGDLPEELQSREGQDTEHPEDTRAAADGGGVFPDMVTDDEDGAGDDDGKMSLQKVREKTAGRDGRSEEELLKEYMLQYNGNVSAIARELGVARSTLYRRMKKYGLYEE